MRRIGIRGWTGVGVLAELTAETISPAKMAHTIAFCREDPAVKVRLGFGGFSDQEPWSYWSIRVAHEDIEVKA